MNILQKLLGSSSMMENISRYMSFDDFDKIGRKNYAMQLTRAFIIKKTNDKTHKKTNKKRKK